MNIKNLPKILLCDDDPSIHDSAKLYLGRSFQLIPSYSVVEAKKILASKNFDAVVIDLNFEGQQDDGVELINEVSKKYSHLEMFVLSGDKTTERVVEVAQMSNITFIVKGPTCFQRLHTSIVEKLIGTNESDYLDPEMKILFKNVERIISSKSESPMLITGETGSGKEFLATAIAKQIGKKLKAINMTSIPKETAESILFGHEKGSFTGAIASKIGLFEVANHGILFLDEIGECDLSVQAKILRAIQEKQIQPLGSNRIIKVGVQLIAATHKNLHDATQNGSFRLDLLQRLNTFSLEIPPLRMRPTEIEYLAKKYLRDFTNGKIKISDPAINILKRYYFPGNIRELKSIMERAAIFSNKNEIDVPTIEHCIEIGNPKFRNLEVEKENNFKEREILCQVLKDSKGNKHKAAQKLNIGRTSIYRKIDFYQIKEEEYC